MNLPARRRPQPHACSAFGGSGGGGGGGGDPYTEVTYSHGGDPTFRGALGGSVLGFLLLGGATALLWFNEASAVAASSGLLEARSHYAAGTRGVTHVTGQLKGTQGGVRDPDHGVEASSSMWLERTPEVYQWKEVEHTTTRKVRAPGNRQDVSETTKTYTYDKVWSASAIDSRGFKDPRGGRHNPPFSEALHTAGRELGRPFDSARWSQPVTLQGLSLGPALLRQAEVPAAAGAPVYAPGHRCDAVARGGGDPDVGCARLTWRHAPFGTQVSALGERTAAGALVSWRARGGDGGGISGGYELGLLMRGVHGAEEMFAAAASTNAAWKWSLRAAGAPAAWRLAAACACLVHAQRVHVQRVHAQHICTPLTRVPHSTCSGCPCRCAPGVGRLGTGPWTGEPPGELRAPAGRPRRLYARQPGHMGAQPGYMDTDMDMGGRLGAWGHGLGALG